MVEQWVQATHDQDYAACARLEKLAPLEGFVRMLTERGVTMLPAILRRRVIAAEVWRTTVTPRGTSSGSFTVNGGEAHGEA